MEPAKNVTAGRVPFRPRRCLPFTRSAYFFPSFFPQTRHIAGGVGCRGPTATMLFGTERDRQVVVAFDPRLCRFPPYFVHLPVLLPDQDHVTLLIAVYIVATETIEPAPNVTGRSSCPSIPWLCRFPPELVHCPVHPAGHEQVALIGGAEMSRKRHTPGKFCVGLGFRPCLNSFRDRSPGEIER